MPSERIQGASASITEAGIVSEILRQGGVGVLTYGGFEFKLALLGAIKETVTASSGSASRSIQRNSSCLELYFRAGTSPLPPSSSRPMTLF